MFGLITFLFVVRFSKNIRHFFCQDYANSKIVKFVSVGCLGCEILAKMFRSDIGKMVGFCNFFLPVVIS